MSLVLCVLACIRINVCMHNNWVCTYTSRLKVIIIYSQIFYTSSKYVIHRVSPSDERASKLGHT